MLRSAALAPSPERRAAVERAWFQLTGAGPVLSSIQRQAVIARARAAWRGAPAPDAVVDPAGAAAHWLAIDAEGMSGDIVAELEANGIDRWQYLEIVGVVARLANIDFYVAGLGAEPFPLPPADARAPTGERHEAAQITNMWVPTVGRASAPTVLDALPAEGTALRDLHEPMYVDLDVIADGTYFDALTKVQIEYIAARTSYLNECFY